METNLAFIAFFSHNDVSWIDFQWKEVFELDRMSMSVANIRSKERIEKGHMESFQLNIDFWTHLFRVCLFLFDDYNLLSLFRDYSKN